MEVLGGAEEPVEGDDDEVDNVLVEAAFFRVVEVKGVQEGSQDGDVCRVGSSGGVILVPEALEESSEYWIV
jgi:hypothetical protein